MLKNLKICIVFNSGACGDFFAQLLKQQYENVDWSIDNNGAAANFDAEQFKNACQSFYENNFDPAYFDIEDNITIGNTHYCYQELLDMFPTCNFYYINDTNYVDITTKYYIKKRLQGGLIEYVQQKKLFRNINLKNKNISNDSIERIMQKDWKKHLAIWQELNIPSIPLPSIVDKKKCKKIVKNIIKIEFNEDKFNNAFDDWADKNFDLINSVLKKYDQRL